MRYALTFALWIIGTPLLISQKVDITLHQEIFYGAHASIILVSTDNGAIVHKFALERELATQDINFQVNRIDATEKLHLTVLNEYEQSFIGIPYFRAFTQYDIPDNYELEDASYVAPLPKEVNPPKLVKVFVSGVKKVNDVFTFAQPKTSKYGFKKRKKKLAFSYHYVPGRDLYILLKCNNEAQYRYIYLPNAEVKQKLYLHYAALPNDLAKHTLNFPFPKDWEAWTMATNTKSKHSVFLRNVINKETNQIDIYIPQAFNFYDFNASIKTPEAHSTPYSINASDFEGLSKLFEKVPVQTKVRFHSTGFTFNDVLSSNIDEFIIKYWLKPQKLRNEQNNPVTAQLSNWYIKGKAAQHINFVLPEIPPHYYDELLLSKPVKVVDIPSLYLNHQYLEGSIRQSVNIKE